MIDLSPLRGKKVYVTGSGGLIGKALVTVLKNSGAEVVAPPRQVLAANMEMTRLRGERADYVIHAAGYAQPGKFTRDPLGTISVNTDITKQLLMNVLDVHGRFLFCSSSEIYSGGNTLLMSEEEPGRTLPQHPRGMYIEAKRCGEAICLNSGRDVRIARIHSVYGPGVRKDDSRVMSQFIDSALRDKKIVMRDSGRAVRHYLYIADAVDMLLNVLLHSKSTIYNVAGKHNTQILGLAMDISNHVPGTTVAPGRGGEDIVNIKPKIDKYVAEFGRPNWTRWADGLEATIQHHRSLL